MSGRQLYDRLRDEYQLQMEMVSAEYVLAMTTVGDRPEGLQRLAEALEEMDVSEGNFQSVIEKPEPPERALEINSLYCRRSSWRPSSVDRDSGQCQPGSGCDDTEFT